MTPTTPNRPTRRDYPNNEENMEAPLVPFIETPDENETDIRRLRTELAAMRAQLDRIEATLGGDR
jgi:hypothetical protein